MIWPKKTRSNVAKNTKTQELVITRIFDAPREFVWKAWTESEHNLFNLIKRKNHYGKN